MDTIRTGSSRLPPALPPSPLSCPLPTLCFCRSAWTLSSASPPSCGWFACVLVACHCCRFPSTTRRSPSLLPWWNMFTKTSFVCSDLKRFSSAQIWPRLNFFFSPHPILFLYLLLVSAAKNVFHTDLMSVHTKHTWILTCLPVNALFLCTTVSLSISSAHPFFF